jgi:hypothetical protein
MCRTCASPSPASTITIVVRVLRVGVTARRSRRSGAIQNGVTLSLDLLLHPVDLNTLEKGQSTKAHHHEHVLTVVCHSSIIGLRQLIYRYFFKTNI